MSGQDWLDLWRHACGSHTGRIRLCCLIATLVTLAVVMIVAAVVMIA